MWRGRGSPDPIPHTPTSRAAREKKRTGPYNVEKNRPRCMWGVACGVWGAAEHARMGLAAKRSQQHPSTSCQMPRDEFVKDKIQPQNRSRSQAEGTVLPLTTES